MKKILFIVNVDWFFLSHRLPIALKALEHGYSVTIACKMTIHGDKLVEMGFEVVDVPFSRSGRELILELKTIKKIHGLINQINPDLIHCVTVKPVLYTGLVLRIIKRDIPFVAAISGLGYIFTATSLRAKMTRFLVSFLYKIALSQKIKAVIFQNTSDAESLSNAVKLSVEDQRLICGSGVDLSVYEFKPENINQPVVIVIASRLLKEKGVYEFVKSAKLVKETYPEARFLIVGSPDYENPNTIQQYEIDKWVNQKYVEFLGQCNNIPQIFADSNIVCLPSFYGEGVPKVLIEAAACGRAVITTDHPGCRDAIDPGLSGILIPIRDETALACAIQDLIKSPKKRIEMGIAGRELAQREFAIEKVVDEHMKIYKDLLLKVK